MTIHKLMNSCGNVSPDVEIDVFTFSLDRCIYSGRYDESPTYVHMSEIYEFRITGMNGMRIERVSITLEN